MRTSAEWKGLDTKGQLSYEFTDMRLSGAAELLEMESRLGVQGPEMGSGELNGDRTAFG